MRLPRDAQKNLRELGRLEFEQKETDLTVE